MHAEHDFQAVPKQILEGLEGFLGNKVNPYTFERIRRLYNLLRKACLHPKEYASSKEDQFYFQDPQPLEVFKKNRQHQIKRLSYNFGE